MRGFNPQIFSRFLFSMKFFQKLLDARKINDIIALVF